MNRRNLFKLIGGALCAASIELTGVAPRMPKLEVNPAYATAMYEEVMVFHPTVWGPSKTLWVNNDPTPIPTGLRYSFVDGEWVKVSPEI